MPPRMRTFATLVVGCAVLGGAPPARAQGTAAVAARSFLRAGQQAGADTATTARPPSALVMIRNRARTLGDQLVRQTRYVAITDRDLVGQPPAAILQRLAPTVAAGDPVRRLEIVVDLRHPLILTVPAGEPVYIGTALVEPRAGVQRIETHATIQIPAGVTLRPR